MSNILFVCTGNTCRSPMAAALLKNQKVSGINVKSAGVFANNGSEASQNTKQALVEVGIEEPHSSTLLGSNDVEWATYILTMTESHKQLVLERFPDSRKKTFTLKELVLGVSGANQDIIDPYGGPLSMYRETMDELVPLIEKLVVKLQTEEK